MDPIALRQTLAEMDELSAIQRKITLALAQEQLADLESRRAAREAWGRFAPWRDTVFTVGGALLAFIVSAGLIGVGVFLLMRL